MYIEFIVLSLIAHVLGDYYLQDDEMSKLKKERLKGVLKHSAFYSIPFLLTAFSNSFMFIANFILSFEICGANNSNL